VADEADIISRDDLNSNKNIFMEQQLYAMKIADIYNYEVKKRLTQVCKFKAVFPSADTLYHKDLVKEMDPIYQKNKLAKKKYFEDRAENKHKINTIDRKMSKENENTSTSSKDETINENELVKSIDHVFRTIHHLYINKEKSRFDFVITGKMVDSIEIPKFIKDLICKKVSRHKLTKRMIHSEDMLYSDNNLETEYLNKNPWAQFIVENKTVNDDWEFIQDFDYINSMILDKRKHH
jgi:hypothetical protein